MKALAQAGRLMLMSPHLDDGVFSCGDLLGHHPGATVVTIFAGTPGGQVSTEWDRRCGFRDPTEALRTRREEDRQALAHLQAKPLWLDFLDSQYQATPPVAELADALHTLIEREQPETIVLPMGLFHSDHVLVSDALLTRLPARTTSTWVIYEDALYRCIAGQVQARLATLAERGTRLTPLRVEAPPSKGKAVAVRCYASQLRAFGEGGWRDLDDPERYWLLERGAPP